MSPFDLAFFASAAGLGLFAAWLAYAPRDAVPGTASEQLHRRADDLSVELEARSAELDRKLDEARQRG